MTRDVTQDVTRDVTQDVTRDETQGETLALPWMGSSVGGGEGRRVGCTATAGPTAALSRVQ